MLLAAANNTPNISISPITQDVVEGSTSAFVTINIDECPSKDSITIDIFMESTFVRSVIFDQTSCTKTFTEEVPFDAAVIENDFTVQIMTNSGTSNNNHNITNADAEMVVIELPSNTPSIAMSPATKNISIETSTVEFDVSISECPNKENINIIWTNENNVTDTGTIVFTKDLNNLCTKSISFTGAVPSGLNISDTFDINISAITSGSQKIGGVSPSIATITILETVSNLNISKLSNPSVVNIENSFDYIIDVTNNGEKTTTGTITVVDELPNVIEIDLAQTNALSSPHWTCSLNNTTLTCEHNNDIAVGTTNTIIIKATAPILSASIINTATVYSGNDSDILNNTASARTTIIDQSRADDICYIKTGNEESDNKCTTIDNSDFFTGFTPSYSCNSEETIINKNPSLELNYVSISKQYTPNIHKGSCITPAGTSCQPSSVIISYPGVGTDEYTYTLGTIGIDSNITIGDTGTGRIGDDLNNSILYATYKKDGYTYSGQIFACTGGSSDSNASVSDYIDAVDLYADTTYTDINGPDIKTKVSNKGAYNIDAVYLGSDASGVENYTPTGDFHLLPITVEITVADTTCENEKPLIADNGSPFGWAEILVGANSGTIFSPVTFPDSAMKDARLLFKAMDWNNLFNGLDISNSCKVSSTHGALCGVPSCLSSATQANEAFPPDTEDNIRILTECYGLNSDGSGSVGATSACQVNNYNGNCGGVKTPGVIQPPKYDNMVGCLACIMDKATIPSCSVDHFSIRPDRFELTSTNSHYPDLLRAGADYNLTINAYDYNSSEHINVNTADYNQTKSQMEASDSNVTTFDGSTTSLPSELAGKTVEWSNNDFNMSNGLSDNAGNSNVAGVLFNDIAFVKLIVKDKNWAAIDINENDTPPDCTEDGAYICTPDAPTVEFIPHHFTITDINISNYRTTNNYTYIANLEDLNISTYNMAGQIQVTITAKYKDANDTNNSDATLNFQTGNAFYENDLNVSFVAFHTNHHDANTTTIQTARLGGFINGQKTIILDNDSNLSQVLRFNFSREVNTSVNPLIIYPADINITTHSYYLTTMGAPAGSADINGTENGLGDGNTTFIYGRTHAGRQRYKGFTGTANIYYEGYCYGTDTKNVDCNTSLLLPFSPSLKRTDDSRWYVNESHKATTDGNIGTVKQKTDNIVDVTNQNDDDSYNPATADLRYGTVANPAPYGYPYKTTMENNASRWLIYNRDNPNATKNEFQVEFDEEGDWSGEHETNTTTKSDNAIKTNRRSMW
ncbi:MAG: hypothetical protein J7J96_00145 [Sulfurimonas sp.]|nr:hypothetical protein [Sulfurimonas sp.]